MAPESRIDLQVPYHEKDEAKQYGARFDWNKKVWFVPPGNDLSLFSKWLPGGDVQATTVPLESTLEKGIELSAYLVRISEAVRRVGVQPEWVRCEIAEIKEWPWGAVVELVETGVHGNPVAKSGAKIWQREKTGVFSSFEQATGSVLAPGMKVLLQVTAEFSIQYSFSLHIKNIDPAYTLGEMAVKLRQIRASLKRKGLYDRNKRYPMPVDYFRVAVVSPQNAAALGDWKTEASILQRYRVCEFVYFTATFQGDKAEDSVTAAIESALARHAEQPFDVLVVIRGGGATLDLASLNSEKIATTLCTAPLPVLTGIGHERDTVILDEVACHCFDTPSKVANYVFNIIQRRAERLKANLSNILRFANATTRLQGNSIDDRWRSAAAHARAAVRYAAQRLIVPAHGLQGNAVRIKVQACYRLTSQVGEMVSNIAAMRRHTIVLAGNKAHSLVIRVRQELAVAAMRLSAQMRTVLHLANSTIREQRQSIDDRRGSTATHARAAVKYTTQQLIVPARRLQISTAQIKEQTSYRLTRQISELTSNSMAVQRHGMMLVTNRMHTLVIHARRDAAVAAMQLPPQIHTVQRSISQRIRQSRLNSHRGLKTIQGNTLRSRKEAGRLASAAREKLTYLVRSEASQARTRIDLLYKNAIGQGPDQILARGFALVRDINNNVIPTGKRARTLKEMEIQFRDGRLRVRKTQNRK